MEKSPDRIWRESKIIVVDGVVVKNNTGLTRAQALIARHWEIPPEGYRLAGPEDLLMINSLASGSVDGLMVVNTDWEKPVWKPASGDAVGLNTVYAVPIGYKFEPENSAPKGKRIVPLAERLANDYAEGANPVYSEGQMGCWAKSKSDYRWTCSVGIEWAIDEGFKFEPEVVEISAEQAMIDLALVYGKEVKITK